VLPSVHRFHAACIRDWLKPGKRPCIFKGQGTHRGLVNSPEDKTYTLRTVAGLKSAITESPARSSFLHSTASFAAGAASAAGSRSVFVFKVRLYVDLVVIRISLLDARGRTTDGDVINRVGGYGLHTNSVFLPKWEIDKPLCVFL